jgi:hypothetical protein
VNFYINYLKHTTSISMKKKSFKIRHVNRYEMDLDSEEWHWLNYRWVNTIFYWFNKIHNFADPNKEKKYQILAPYSLLFFSHILLEHVPCTYVCCHVKEYFHKSQLRFGGSHQIGTFFMQIPCLSKNINFLQIWSEESSYNIIYNKITFNIH